MADGKDRPVTNRQRLVVLALFFVIAGAAILNQLGFFGNGASESPEESADSAPWVLEEWTSPENVKGWQAFVLLDGDTGEGNGSDDQPARVFGVRCLAAPVYSVSVFVNAGARLSHRPADPADFEYGGCARPRPEPIFPRLPSGSTLTAVLDDKTATPAERDFIQRTWEAAGPAYRQCLDRNALVEERRKSLAPVSVHVTAGRKSVANFLSGHHRDFGEYEEKARCTGFRNMTVLEMPSSFSRSPLMQTTELAGDDGPETIKAAYRGTLARHVFLGDVASVSHPARIDGGGCVAGTSAAPENGIVTESFSTAQSAEMVDRLKELCNVENELMFQAFPSHKAYAESETPGSFGQDFTEEIYEKLPDYKYDEHGDSNGFGDCRDENWSSHPAITCP